MILNERTTSQKVKVKSRQSVVGRAGDIDELLSVQLTTMLPSSGGGVPSLSSTLESAMGDRW